MMLQAMGIAGGCKVGGIGKGLFTAAAFFVTAAAAEKISHDGCAYVISDSESVSSQTLMMKRMEVDIQ